VSINEVDMTFWLWLHSQRKRHRRYMIAAEEHLLNAYQMKEEGRVIEGLDELDRCTTSLARCGCPVTLWPENVREKIPTEMGGTA
jgi:hypothetical protein